MCIHFSHLKKVLIDFTLYESFFSLNKQSHKKRISISVDTICIHWLCVASLRLNICVTYISRAPTQIAFSNSLCFPCFFPVRRQIFPVPIYVICNYYIHKTDLADFSSFKKQFSQPISKYLLPLESGNLQLEQTKFPVFWQNFQIPCVFPDRTFLGPFSLFSLCSGYPVLGKRP